MAPVVFDFKIPETKVTGEQRRTPLALGTRRGAFCRVYRCLSRTAIRGSRCVEVPGVIAIDFVDCQPYNGFVGFDAFDLTENLRE